MLIYYCYFLYNYVVCFCNFIVLHSSDYPPNLHLHINTQLVLHNGTFYTNFSSVQIKAKISFSNWRIFEDWLRIHNNLLPQGIKFKGLPAKYQNLIFKRTLRNNTRGIITKRIFALLRLSYLIYVGSCWSSLHVQAPGYFIALPPFLLRHRAR